MSPLNKKSTLVIISIGAIIVAIIFPFFTREKNETLNTTLSFSFTAASTVAAFIALYIGFLLYDRFGLGGKFIEKKTETVLELANVLKGTMISGHSANGTYRIPISKTLMTRFNCLNFYEADKKKEIIVNSDEYEQFTRQILVLKRSYWMPNEIKSKLEFFDAAMTRSLELDEKEYIALSFGNEKPKDSRRLFPKMTYGEFLMNIQNLAIEMEIWLNNHSSVPIDLKLEERA